MGKLILLLNKFLSKFNIFRKRVDYIGGNDALPPPLKGWRRTVSWKISKWWWGSKKYSYRKKLKISSLYCKKIWKYRSWSRGLNFRWNNRSYKGS